MENTNLIYGLSIKERYHELKKSYSGKTVEDYIEQWGRRRSLGSQERFHEYLKWLNISELDFNLGIKTLNSEDEKNLFLILEKQEWFLNTKEIFSQEEIEYTETSDADFSYALRFHINYFKEIITLCVMPFGKIDEKGKEKFFEQLMKDLLSVSIKTFVFDLHEQKRKAQFKGANSKERHRFYIIDRFGTNGGVQQFFFEYPVLCRLLAERLKFHLDDYKQFMQGIEESAEEISKMFFVKPPFNLELLQVDAGDSHCKGKSIAKH